MLDRPRRGRRTGAAAGLRWMRRLSRRGSCGNERGASCRIRSCGTRLRSCGTYLTVTVAPAPSRAAFALSAASLLTLSSTSFGAPSTRSLASFSPRLVRLRTSLMTWIFLSPAASSVTLNSSFSSGASATAAPPPAAGAATATGAAALTSNVSSNCFTNSDSSRRVISLNASSRSSVLSFAIVLIPPSTWRLSVSSMALGHQNLRVLLVSGSALAAALGRGVGRVGRAGRLRRGLGATLLGPLGPQGLGELGDLRRQCVEHRGGAGHRRRHGAGQLGEQNVARLQVRQLGDLVGRERLAVEHAPLDHQSRVVPGKVAQAFGGLDHIATDERDGGRAGKQRGELVVQTSLAHRDLGEGVLDHVERGVLPECLTKQGELGNAESPVLGEHNAVRVLEPVGELRNRSHLVRSRHGPPFSCRTRLHRYASAR